MRAIILPVLGLLALATGAALPKGREHVADLQIERLTAERLVNPLGLDDPHPRLAWTLRSGRRGEAQTDYQVLVATSPEALEAGRGDVWDSGKVESDWPEAVYNGAAPKPSTRYYWKVRVWDGDGSATAWSDRAFWETGLPNASDWQAQWIGGPARQPAEPFTLEGASWIWTDAQGAQSGEKSFRGEIDLPGGGITSARLAVTADNRYTLRINGTLVAHGNTWQGALIRNVAQYLKPGVNVIEVDAVNDGGPGGLLARLVVKTPAGEKTLDTSAAWRAGEPGTDPKDWPAAKVVAPYGQGPWKEVHLWEPGPPAPMLRKGFSLAKPIARARLYISGLAYADISLNGHRVGDHALDPAYTRFDKREEYVTYDVTDLLKEGENAVGVTLGRGWLGLTDPNVWGFEHAFWHADPRLLAQLVVDHPDGTHTVIASDGSWQTHDSPTLSDSIHVGEDYDARREQPGWDRPGFDAKGWQPARLITAPPAILVAQQHEPIREVRALRAQSVSSPRPGTYVFDYGTTIAGWARLHVSGPAGATVEIRYGEKLRADGTVNNDNDIIFAEMQVDRYTLKGGGKETWEPRFSYKGFRYIQVDGYPGTPEKGSIEAVEAHTDVRSTGDFECSSDLLNRIHAITRQSILNNLYGIPTDTPVYEKNGWTGDAHLTAETALRNFDMRAIYTKWLADFADAQTPAGMVPMIVPSPGWGEGDAPEWGSAYMLIAWYMVRYTGDTRLLERHYPHLVKYLDYMAATRQDGVPPSALGDWLPPGYGGGLPPEGPQVTVLCYLYNDAKIMSRIAQSLGHAEDAARFEKLAGELKDTLNAKCLDRVKGIYHTDREAGYRQTSNLLPLAYGMVPDDMRGKVLANLVADIHAKGEHLDVGILGTKELLPFLTENGYADLAYRVGTQTTHPSWGFWLENGATALWESWDLDSRSRDHHMFGSIEDWFFGDLAGIKPTEPGYRAIRIRPYTPAGLTHARASTETPFGPVASEWTRDAGGTLTLTVTIPPGAHAQIHVPAASEADAKEIDIPTGAPAATFTMMEDGCAVFSTGSGTYRFRSR